MVKAVLVTPVSYRLRFGILPVCGSRGKHAAAKAKKSSMSVPDGLSNHIHKSWRPQDFSKESQQQRT